MPSPDASWCSGWGGVEPVGGCLRRLWGGLGGAGLFFVVVGAGLAVFGAGWVLVGGLGRVWSGPGEGFGPVREEAG